MKSLAVFVLSTGKTLGSSTTGSTILNATNMMLCPGPELKPFNIHSVVIRLLNGTSSVRIHPWNNVLSQGLSSILFAVSFAIDDPMPGIASQSTHALRPTYDSSFPLCMILSLRNGLDTEKNKHQNISASWVALVVDTFNLSLPSQLLTDHLGRKGSTCPVDDGFFRNSFGALGVGRVHTMMSSGYVGQDP